MLITTFNVNSVRSRLHILTKWINENKPDFLFMQETKTQDINFPENIFHELGYKSHFCGEKSYNGVAVIVKNNIDDIDVNFGFDDDSFRTRVLFLRHKSLTILNTYVPQGKDITHKDFIVKQEFFERVREIIEREKNNLFLWLGDLNVAPENIDVTHPENKKNHVCFCKEIREIFNQTKNNLVDLFRKINGDITAYTFYDYRVKDAVERNIGWRIDHMLASEKLSEYATKCFIDVNPRTWEKPSDHTPLCAEINI